ncbi:MAG: hypothetical protein HY908_09820, partial [Myxococcales bacterium]|nr:hypothetical protein [Myxococcales bacterium]
MAAPSSAMHAGPWTMRGLVAVIALVVGCGPRHPRVAPAPVGPSPPYVLATASWGYAPAAPPGVVAPALPPLAPA